MDRCWSGGEPKDADGKCACIRQVDTIADLTRQLAEVKERLYEQIEDNGRIHDEKMKLWHDADDLKRQLAKAREEIERHNVTSGVGDGGGKSFVHGNYESIKIVQNKLTDLVNAREDNARLRKALENICSFFAEDSHDFSYTIAKEALEASDG